MLHARLSAPAIVIATSSATITTVTVTIFIFAILLLPSFFFLLMLFFLMFFFASHAFCNFSRNDSAQYRASDCGRGVILLTFARLISCKSTD